MTPLDGHRVAVGTTVPPQVLVFDRDGPLHATLGREGDGPGEFLTVGSVVAIAADSVGVWDPDRRRLTIFSVGGAFGREVDLGDTAPMSARGASNTREASGFTHLHPSAPGSLVLFGEAVLGPGSDPVISRHQMPAYRIGADGQILAEYGSFPGLQTSPGLATPFGARTHGASVADALVVGTGEATEYRSYGLDGALTRIVRWPDRERAVAGPIYDRWSELLEAEQPALREYVLSSPRPADHPAHDDILISGEGDVLVADYPGPLGILSLRRADPAPEQLKPTLRMPERRWLAFDTEGTLRGRLTTPEGFEPNTLSDGLLWGVYTDELDVESVRAYALVRG